MEGVGHMDAVPPTVDGLVDDVGRLGKDADMFEDEGELDAGPFADGRPAFFAGLLGDLGAGSEVAHDHLGAEFAGKRLIELEQSLSGESEGVAGSAGAGGHPLTA